MTCGYLGRDALPRVTSVEALREVRQEMGFLLLLLPLPHQYRILCGSGDVLPVG